MAAPEPRRGAGAFHWNAGGWFGAIVGSTLWLLILGLSLAAKGQRAAALAALGAFLVPNAAGLLLWSRRSRLAPYPSLQAAVALIGLSTLAALLRLDHLGALAAVDSRFASQPRQLYWILVLHPALMALFFVRERAARREPAGTRDTRESS